MFSATMPLAVEKLIKRYLRFPAFISIGDIGAGKKDIEQRVELMEENEKKKRLKAILDKVEGGPIIIFLNEKKAVDYIHSTLEKWGVRSLLYSLTF
jgi:ATP-dependent RNA helicase DDX23/PRP28